jgi:hypothetical protein
MTTEFDPITHPYRKGERVGAGAGSAAVLEALPVTERACGFCGAALVRRPAPRGTPGYEPPGEFAARRFCGRECVLAWQRAGGGPSRAQPPKPCQECGRLAKPLRHGRCAACARRRRRGPAGAAAARGPREEGPAEAAFAAWWARTGRVLAALRDHARGHPAVDPEALAYTAWAAGYREGRRVAARWGGRADGAGRPGGRESRGRRAR